MGLRPTLRLAHFVSGSLKHQNHLYTEHSKMKKTAIFLSLAILFGGAACDKQTTQNNPTNKQTQTATEPKSVVYTMKNYDEVYSFQNGLAKVEKGGKFGFIDKTGKEVVPLQYDDAQDFNQELAAVNKEGKWGFVDKTGKERTAMIYEQIWPLEQGYFAVQRDITNWNGNILRWGIVDGFALEVVPAIQRNNGFVSFSPNEGLFQFTTTENRVGFVDKQGREVVPFQYDNFSEESDEGSVCKEGLCVVAKNGQYGFVDTTGRLAIMLQYEYANDFSDGLAAVKKNNKWGFVDKTGKEVIALQYDSAHDFSDGLSAVQKGEQWLLIDKTGKEIATLSSYEWVGQFKDGLAQVFNKDNLVGFIDKTGKEVIACQYQNYYDKDGTPFVGNGLLTVAQNDKWGLIDKTGKIVVPAQYDEALMQSDETNAELFSVSKDNHYGFIDKNGKEVIALQYDFAYSFSDGLAAVKKDGKWQYIDKTGKVIIDSEESKEYKADPATKNAPPLPQRFQIDSSQYKVPLYTGEIASKLSLDKSFDDLEVHKENLQEALQEAQTDKQNINFAGQYMVVQSGCGTGCVTFYILDIKTGAVTDSLSLSGYPVDKDGKSNPEEIASWVGWDIAHPKDNRLLFVEGDLGIDENDFGGKGSFAFELKDGKLHFLQHSPVVKMEEI